MQPYKFPSDLTQYGTSKTFEADHVLLDEDSYIRFIPLVQSGIVKVSQLDEQGREMLLYYISPGETCIMSFLGAVCNERSKIRAVVVEQAEIILLPLDKAMTWVRTRPDWLDYIFSLYNKRFEELLAVVNAIAFQKMDERLWDLLQKKAQTLHTQELTVTHQQLAEELGTAREVVSRLLKQLERQNRILLSRNRINLL